MKTSDIPRHESTPGYLEFDLPVTFEESADFEAMSLPDLRAAYSRLGREKQRLERQIETLRLQHYQTQAALAGGEEIMVNAPGGVYTLPMQSSGLTSGPRFVVHVPAQQPAEHRHYPEGIREGAPYDDPAFESLCREHEIWGTPEAAQCAVFWEAGKRVAEQKPAPDVAGLVEALEAVVAYDESVEDTDGNLMMHYADMMKRVRAALAAHRKGDQP